MTLAGQSFLCEDGDLLAELRSTSDRLVLGKSREMLERYDALREMLGPIDTVVDLGIFQGGSAAFFFELFEPDRLLAIDIADSRVAPLDEYIARRSLHGRLIARYGVDQADTAQVLRVLAEEFGGRSIDLVIDDASHLYDATRASFEAVFPLLRAGGYFVIEDWDWAHRPNPTFQEHGGYFRRFPALTNLLVELLMLSASSPGVVRSVHVESGLAIVERGAQPVPEAFVLERHYSNRGLRFRPLL